MRHWYRFEGLLRRLVYKYYPNITIVHGTVVGVTPSDDGSRLVSARIRMSTDEGPTWMERVIPLSFIVDCTGPACAGLRWLSHAYPALDRIGRDVYDPKVHYATATVRPSSGLLARINKELPAEVRDAPHVRLVSPSKESGISAGYSIGRGDHDSCR
jgi:hypothetical protein